MPNRTTIQPNVQGTRTSNALRLIVNDCVLYQYSPDAAQEQITSRKQRRGVSNVFLFALYVHNYLPPFVYDLFR